MSFTWGRRFKMILSRIESIADYTMVVLKLRSSPKITATFITVNIILLVPPKCKRIFGALHNCLFYQYILIAILAFSLLLRKVVAPTRWSKKSLLYDLEEKGLTNSKMFFDGVFLSIYSHLLKKFALSKLCRKKLWGSKDPKNGLF